MRDTIVKGGQGRLASDVERDAQNVLILGVLAVCLVACLVAKGCSAKPVPVPAVGGVK